MKFKASNPAAQLAAEISGTQTAMAKAATETMRSAAEKALQAARGNIASAGFGAKWQGSMQARVFPQTGVSLSPAAEIFSKIPFADIFEDGGAIFGRPLLWLAIEANLPVGRRWTPRRYISAFGPLRLVTHAGRPPLLFDPRKRKFVFVGLDSVTLRKRFNIAGAVRAAVADFDSEYNARLKVV